MSCNFETILLGRMTINGGVIVCVYMDHGEIWCMVEDINGFIFKIPAHGLGLKPREQHATC